MPTFLKSFVRPLGLRSSAVRIDQSLPIHAEHCNSFNSSDFRRGAERAGHRAQVCQHASIPHRHGSCMATTQPDDEHSRMSFPSFCCLRCSLHSSARHSAAISPRPSGAGAGSSGYSSNLGDCVEIAKLSIGRARGCAVTNLPWSPLIV